MVQIYLLVAILFLLTTFYYYSLNHSSVQSSVDGNYYIVANDKDKQLSADYLARINLKVYKLLNYLYDNIETFNDKRGYIERFKRKYSHKVLIENINKNSTSYNFNKNKIFLCIKNRDENGNENGFVDENLMMYVVIHELAHFISLEFVSEKEHYTNKEFKEIFKLLLKVSADLGIYTKIQNPRLYCGIKVKRF